MAKVWESSQHAGSDLLMLLAIADFADDDGNAYPAVSTLAAKCRMKPRNCRYLLRTLEESGELSIEMGTGPHGANFYRINLESLGLQHSAGVQSLAGLQHSATPPATQCRNPLHHSAAKPSKNHQEPPISAHAAKNQQHEAADDGFAAFWLAYPRKVAKADAVKAWKRVKPKDRPAVMAALDVQKASDGWTKDGGKFIPYPASWIRAERWMDEQPTQGSTAPAADSVFAGAV